MAELRACQITDYSHLHSSLLANSILLVLQMNTRYYAMQQGNNDWGYKLTSTQTNPRQVRLECRYDCSNAESRKMAPHHSAYSLTSLSLIYI